MRYESPHNNDVPEGPKLSRHDHAHVGNANHHSASL